MGTITKFATSVILTVGLASSASALAAEQTYAAPTSTGSRSAGVITLP